MVKRVFYEKIDDEYVPVREYDSELIDSFHYGTHLVMCYSGGRSTRYDIDPAFAPMIAAGRYAEDKIALAIVGASMMKPSKNPITDEQRDAWNILCQAFGDDMYTLQTTSAMDIAREGVEAMQQEAERLLKNPAVLAAYEHFMLLCKLTEPTKEE